MHWCICYIEQSNGPLLENRYQTQVVSIVDASDDAYLGKEGREAAQALAMELIPGTKGHPLTPESDVPCRGGVVWGLPLLTRTPAFGNGQEAHRGFRPCSLHHQQHRTNDSRVAVIATPRLKDHSPMSASGCCSSCLVGSRRRNSPSSTKSGISRGAAGWAHGNPFMPSIGFGSLRQGFHRRARCLPASRIWGYDP
jgi:hypothetical protein